MSQHYSSHKELYKRILGLSLPAVGLLGLVLLAKSEGEKKSKSDKPKRKEKKKSEKDSSGKSVDKEFPEQQVGDTPTAPWEMPTPEEKAKTEPVRKALDKAVSRVDSPEKAEEVASQLEEIAGGTKAKEVKEEEQAKKAGDPGDTLTQAAKGINQTAKKAPKDEKAASVITETAKEIAVNHGRQREALAEATQEVLNPQQQGAPAAIKEPQRQYLRRAIIKRMGILDAVDAEVFLAINHLPHNRLLNGFFYFFTFTFTGGAGWYGLMALSLLFNRRQGWNNVRRSLVPLAVAAWTVEHPIKTFFRRRRPFIKIIQAIVIGKKPGSWSFPSGHSAAAFAGARLFAREYPAQRWLFYTLAGLIGFSRIYLGDHYPGDVVSGSLSGMLIAEGTRKMLKLLAEQFTR